MRKKLITPVVQNNTLAHQEWMDLESIAQVELTSEDAANPIEQAFTPDMEHGWKAAEPGEQTIRLLFDQPQRIQHIQLLFREAGQTRTQEFLLRCSSDRGKSYKDIVRQQYNFSPPDTTLQNENYSVALEGVTTIELIINPDISGGNTYASLTGLQLA